MDEEVVEVAPALRRRRESIRRGLASWQHLHARQLRNATIHRIGGERRGAQLEALAVARQAGAGREAAQEDAVGGLLATQLLPRARDECVDNARGLLGARRGGERVRSWDRLALLVGIGVAHIAGEAGAAQHGDETMPHARLEHDLDVLDPLSARAQRADQPRALLAPDASRAPVGHDARAVNGAEVGARRHVAALETHTRTERLQHAAADHGLERVVAEERQVAGPAARRDAGRHRLESAEGRCGNDRVQVRRARRLERRLPATHRIRQVAHAVQDEQHDLGRGLEREGLENRGPHRDVTRRERSRAAFGIRASPGT